MLFLGGSMHGRELSVAPDQHAFVHRAARRVLLTDPGYPATQDDQTYDVYERRPVASGKRWRNVMVKTDLSEDQAGQLLYEWLLARWFVETHDPEGGML